MILPTSSQRRYITAALVLHPVARRLALSAEWLPFRLSDDGATSKSMGPNAMVDLASLDHQLRIICQLLQCIHTMQSPLLMLSW